MIRTYQLLDGTLIDLAELNRDELLWFEFAAQTYNDTPADEFPVIPAHIDRRLYSLFAKLQSLRESAIRIRICDETMAALPVDERSRFEARAAEMGNTGIRLQHKLRQAKVPKATLVTAYYTNPISQLNSDIDDRFKKAEKVPLQVKVWRDKNKV